MEEDRRIEKKLRNYGIQKYKITRAISKSFSYLYKHDETLIEEGDEDKIRVKFLYQNRVGIFSISSYQPEYIIDLVIKECILNIHDRKEMWIDEDLSEDNSDKLIQGMYNNYNKDNYINWLESEIKKISYGIGNSIATYYKICLSKYSLRTETLYIEEYLAHSQITVIANKCKAEAKDRWLYDAISDYIIKQLIIPKPIYKDCDINNNFIIKGKAVSQIINKYILMYYSCYINENGSFIKIDDLEKKILEKDIDIISLSYQNIYFDGEGEKIKKKEIVKSGVLKDILSNNFYSTHLGIESYGNAGMEDPDIIAHQRIIIRFNTMSREPKGEKTIIHEFSHLNLDFHKLELTGMAVLENTNDKYLSTITFKLNELLNRVYYTGTEYNWYNNVF